MWLLQKSKTLMGWTPPPDAADDEPHSLGWGIRRANLAIWSTRTTTEKQLVVMILGMTGFILWAYGAVRGWWPGAQVSDQ